MSCFKLNELTPMTPEEYATHWGLASDVHENENDYNWITSQLTPCISMLEVGCGNGNSTKKLLNISKKVVSIEINDSLIQTAELNLQQAGYNVTVITPNSTKKIDLSSNIDCFLVHASIFDKKVPTLLSGLLFNYVIFSFFGSAPIHAAQELGKTLDELDKNYALDYREKATLRAFELKNMSKSCTLCVVDRVNQSYGFSKFDVRNAVADNLATRLGISKNQISVKTKVNTAMQKTSNSEMRYITNASMSQANGTPLIALSLV